MKIIIQTEDKSITLELKDEMVGHTVESLIKEIFIPLMQFLNYSEGTIKDLFGEE